MIEFLGALVGFWLTLELLRLLVSGILTLGVIVLLIWAVRRVCG